MAAKKKTDRVKKIAGSKTAQGALAKHKANKEKKRFKNRQFDSVRAVVKGVKAIKRAVTGKKK